MASHTTLADVEAYSGQVYTAQEQTRIAVMIVWAERDLASLAGRDFYNAAAPTSDASQDWLLATAMLVERYLLSEDPEVKAALAGPYASEQLGDYRYTVKPNATDALSDARLQRIILRNSGIRVTPFPAFRTSGPAPLLPTDGAWISGL